MEKKVITGTSRPLLKESDYEFHSYDIKQRLISYYKNTNFSLLQDKVNNYFYNTGKEIKYIFKLNKDKKDELSNLIRLEMDNDRKIELELLLYGFAYNKDDLSKYTEISVKEQLQEKREFYIKDIKNNFYDSISIIDNKDGNNIISRKLNGTISKIKFEGSVKDKYIELNKILKTNNLNIYYKTNSKDKTITLIYGNKKVLSDLSTINKNEELKVFYTSDQAIKDLGKIIPLNDNEVNLNDITNKVNVYSYFEIHSNKILTNLNQLEKIGDKTNSNFSNSGIKLIGITLTGKKDLSEKTGANPDFFRIGKNIYLSYLRKIFREKKSIDKILDISRDKGESNISINNELYLLLEENVEESFINKLNERLTTRLANYMDLVIKGVEDK